MVDPIGAKPVSPLDRRIAPVAAGTPAAPVAESGDAAHETASIAEAARQAAQAAPVDHERVAALRTAIANGDYRPAPRAIADKMIGAMQEWIAK